MWPVSALQFHFDIAKFYKGVTDDVRRAADFTNRLLAVRHTSVTTFVTVLNGPSRASKRNVFANWSRPINHR
jgi:hypothetical protein